MPLEFLISILPYLLAFHRHEASVLPFSYVQEVFVIPVVCKIILLTSKCYICSHKTHRKSLMCKFMFHCIILLV